MGFCFTRTSLKFTLRAGEKSPDVLPRNVEKNTPNIIKTIVKLHLI